MLTDQHPVENPRPADLAAAAAAAPVAVPASPGSPAGSAAAATADSKPEAEADWLASMGKRFPPRRRSEPAMGCPWRDVEV